MKLMVIGGGGREHAIIKKLKENPAIEEIYCLPGNGGIAADAVCVSEIGAKDIPAQVEFAKAHGIDYAVVAPDDPLALGAVDALTEAGIPCFGPDKKAAVIEASKAFSKDLMKKYGISTAKYELFTDADAACAYIDSQGAPIVVKADGLALGKGVIVAQTVEEAKAEHHEPVTLPMYGGKPVVTEPLEPTAQREEPEQAQEPEPDYRLIGEVFATYIMAERDNEMLLIDKHAAHERILFNRLKRQHQSGAVERQVLLVPLTIHMPRELYDAAIKNLDCFERAGFAAEDFGEGCLRVREVPTILEDTPAEDLLTELCERLLHRGGMDEEAIYDELYHSVACKAAIKGNIPSMEREQQELLRLLREDPTVRNCPHGRPVAIVITRRELERMFGRIV